MTALEAERVDVSANSFGNASPFKASSDTSAWSRGDEVRRRAWRRALQSRWAAWDS